MIRLALAVLIASAIPAAAQAPCAPRDELLARYAAKYREAPRMIGLTRQGNLVEIWASESGTWTAVVTQPSGQSCITAVGTNLTLLTPKPKPAPERKG
ncbi:MAG: hypothetical protein ABNH26_08855 [Celeribacter sp.]|jgi:hypothetical protein